jgi:hypothetical protein
MFVTTILSLLVVAGIVAATLFVMTVTGQYKD